jgi:hypothetical protein
MIRQLRKSSAQCGTPILFLTTESDDSVKPQAMASLRFACGEQAARRLGAAIPMFVVAVHRRSVSINELITPHPIAAS